MIAVLKHRYFPCETEQVLTGRFSTLFCIHSKGEYYGSALTICVTLYFIMSRNVDLRQLAKENRLKCGSLPRYARYRPERWSWPIQQAYWHPGMRGMLTRRRYQEEKGKDKAANCHLIAPNECVVNDRSEC
jgi:hypothetical protein